MKPFLDQLFSSQEQTFVISESAAYHALNDFHYHPELELIYIIEGQGVLIIGDEFEQLSDNMMILIGSNVPHIFKFETHTYQYSLMKQGKIPVSTKLLTLHFNPEIFGERFMMLPGNSMINDLFKMALNGLVINKETQPHALELMHKLSGALPHEQILLLMQLFTTIAIGKNRSLTTASPEKNAFNKLDEKRLTKVYLYTLNNFTRVIKLKEVAGMVYMVPNAFCRYFKLRTNKSYFEFLMEVRIKHACKLLKEKDYSIVVVCYESGFSNLSNFNRHFKLLTGKTPLAYRKHFQA